MWVSKCQSNTIFTPQTEHVKKTNLKNILPKFSSSSDQLEQQAIELKKELFDIEKSIQLALKEKARLKRDEKEKNREKLEKKKRENKTLT